MNTQILKWKNITRAVASTSKDHSTWRCTIEIPHEILPIIQFSVRYINWVLNMIFIEPWSQREGTPRGTTFNERRRSCIVRASGINHDINDVWNKLNESFFRYRVIGEMFLAISRVGTSSFCNGFQSGNPTEKWTAFRTTAQMTWQNI